jgi:cytochrome c peroxidase
MRVALFILIALAAVAFGLQPVPKWPPRVYVPSPVQQQENCIQLGRALFYDPILSRDSTISCASCHSSYVAFTHVDHTVSHGINDRIGRRNAPALMNLAWSSSFMWDGAINHLDMQPLAPISNALEMDEQLPRVLMKLQRSSFYRRLFAEVYGDSAVTTERMLKAFAAFLITLESKSSRYDAAMRGDLLFTEQERRGYQLFKQQCNQCHTEPLFTNNEFLNNGMEVLSGDAGRAEVSNMKVDSGLFKVPTLRNVYYSRPYMHDGRMPKLSDAVRHYADADFGKRASPEMKNVTGLNEQERVDLTAFLLTLSDSSFVFEKGFQYPFKLFESAGVQD